MRVMVGISSRYGSLPPIVFLLCACLLLVYPAAAAPRLVLLLDRGPGWAQVSPADLPAAAAVAAISDPALAHGPAAAWATLNAGGRNVAPPDARFHCPLDAMPDGRWRVPPRHWQALLAVNHAAHAGAAPGALGDALARQMRVVLIAPPQIASLAALAVANRDGVVSRWYATLAEVPPAEMHDAVLVIAPATAGGAQARLLSRQFPVIPLLYCAVPQTAHFRAARDLMPLYVLGRGPGLLASTRTRWHGVASLLDIGPTVLDLADLPTVEISNPLMVVRASAPAQTVARIAAQARVAQQARTLFIILWAVGLGLAALLRLFFYRARALNGWLLAGWAMPLLLTIVLPALWFLPMPLLVGIFLACWGGAAWGCGRLPLATAWGWATGLGAGALLLTTFANTLLARQPFLGYPLLTGHRYHGIGNEGMAVLVVVLVFAGGWVIWRRPRAGWWLVGLYGVATLGLAMPIWGANWGGAMTVLGAGVVHLAIHRRAHWRWWHLPLAVGGVGMGGVLLLCLISWVDPHAASHAGALGHAVAGGGPQALLTMIARKLDFSGALWVHYQGWIIAAAGALCTGLLIWQTRRALAGPTPWAWAWEATLTAWLIAIFSGIVNDTGIFQTGLMWVTTLPAAALLLTETAAVRQPSACPASQCSPDSVD